MGDRFEYISRASLRLVDGVRQAAIGEEGLVLTYGVPAEIAAHYGGSGAAPGGPATLDHIVAAVGG